MAHFYGICHGNCALSYVRGFLVLTKLNFGGLKGQFDVKKAKFRGLIDKIDHYRLISTTRTHLRPIFIDSGIEIVP